MTSRSRSEVYQHFDVNGKRTACKFCGKDAYKNPSRMALHLTRCSKCPTPIRERMRAELPQSLCKNSHNTILQHSQSSGEFHSFDLADIEVVNEEEVETAEVFFPNQYGNNTRRCDETDLSISPKMIGEKSTDEFTAFGNSVAHKLRNISNPRARIIAQYYINTVLFRAEMTNFKGEISLPTPQEFSLFDSITQENSNKESKPESSSNE